MKRTITLLAICLFAMAANAQVTFRPGIRAGVNIAKITQTDFDAKADFYAGGFGAIRFTRFYTLQPEITYSRQGAAGSPEYYDYNTGTYERYDQDISIQYLSFGLISKFTFNDQFNVHVGPAIDFETGSNVRTNS
ncbi:MAG: PorT family protein, partial [Flavobacterium sp.]